MPFLKMSSFGDRLKDLREASNTTIEQVAAATGIHLGYLEALERNQFDALPGRAFGKLYIRAYARTLGFDPQKLIDQYDRERGVTDPLDLEPPFGEAMAPRRVEAVIASWRRSAIEERSKGNGRDVPDAPGPDLPVVGPGDAALHGSESAVSIDRPAVRWAPNRHWRPRSIALGATSLGLAIVAASSLYGLFGTGAERTPPASPAPPSPEAEPAASRLEPDAVASARVTRPLPALPRMPAQEQPAAPRPARAAARRPGPSGQLAVPDFGLGRRIAERRLQDRAETFARGEVAWFSTRVVGGRAGEVVRHVWLHEGRIQQTIPLRVGGPDWHTHSRKTLSHAGQWAVEARDGNGLVLVRAALICEPTTP